MHRPCKAVLENFMNENREVIHKGKLNFTNEEIQITEQTQVELKKDF